MAATEFAGIAGMGDGTLSDALRRRAHTLRTRASEPSGIKLVDKLLFCAGFTFIPLTEWVMIVHPHRFSYWYRPHALCSPTLRSASAIGSSATPNQHQRHPRGRHRYSDAGGLLLQVHGVDPAAAELAGEDLHGEEVALLPARLLLLHQRHVPRLPRAHAPPPLVWPHLPTPPPQHGSTLQHTAAHCSTLQPHCRTAALRLLRHLHSRTLHAN